MEYKARSGYHHRNKDRTGHPDAPLIEQDTADDKASEDTEHRITTRIETVTSCIPAERRHRRVIEKIRYARKHVVEIERRKHWSDKAEERKPRQPSALSL